MKIILIISICIVIFICIYFIIKSFRQLLYNKQSLKNDIEQLQKEHENLSNIISTKKTLCQDITLQLKSLENQTIELEKSINLYNEQNRVAAQQLDSLNSALQQTQKIYEENKSNFEQKLQKDYVQKQQEFEVQKQALQQTLLSISNEIKAKTEAMRRAQEIEENKDKYRLSLSEKELRDIKLLNSIKDELSNPIVVNKIIWSNYYQPLAKIQFPKIIGKATGCGIYKITNLETNESYIGQSSDLCERWKNHCKEALGAGSKNTTSQGKLYNNIRKYGLSNFTFEVLEICPAAELDKKEKEYISLYDTYNFGLNSTAGNKS